MISATSPNQEGVAGTDSEEVWMITEESAILFISTSLLGTNVFFLIKEAYFYARSLLVSSHCAIRGYGNITPTDPKAIAELKAAGILPASVGLRQVKYLNNLVEQDHRFIKRLVKPGMGFFSLETAGRTLQGYEVMNMIRKGQVHGVGKGDIKGQVSFIASLFGVAAQNQPERKILAPSAPPPVFF